MVAIQHNKPQGGFQGSRKILWIGGGILLTVIYLLSSSSSTEDQQLRAERVDRPNRPQSMEVVLEDEDDKWKKKQKKQDTHHDTTPQTTSACQYNSLSELTELELQPMASERHIRAPPIGGKLSLVCCSSTAGPLEMVVHHKWAPLGAGRFLEMVTSGYFTSGVPLMRCVQGFICQFGLNSDPAKRKDFDETIPDDPNWLPEGKTFRENKLGVKRFAQGYLAYAGGGVNSRNKQLIMALKGNGPLGGGSPWEVPWGELVGPDSFATLGKIYTGYGEKGPPQGRLRREGESEAVRKEWPLLDRITSCQLMDERLQEAPFIEPAEEQKRK